MAPTNGDGSATKTAEETKNDAADVAGVTSGSKTETKSDEVEKDVEKAAEAGAKDLAKAGEDEAEAKLNSEVEEVEPAASAYEALKDFTARVGTQLLNFVKGETIGSRIGHFLHRTGAPVKPVE